MTTDPPTDLDGIRNRFIKLVGELIYHLEVSSQRVDIRDRIAALALVDRVLAREKPDDDAQRGSAVHKYESAFKKAARAGAGNGDPGPAAVGAGADPADYDADASPDGDDAGIPVT
jgi:hypothetical protein